MFSSTKKLDPNLKFLLASSSIKDYRILIQYRNFPDSISKKIRSYRGNIIRKIEVHFSGFIWIWRRRNRHERK